MNEITYTEIDNYIKDYLREKNPSLLMELIIRTYNKLEIQLNSIKFDEEFNVFFLTDKNIDPFSIDIDELIEAPHEYLNGMFEPRK